MTADIDTWRGDVDDTSIITQYATPAKDTYANKLSSDRTTSTSSGWGYSVITSMDNETENSDYYVENFVTSS